MQQADAETMKSLSLDVEKYQALLDGSDMTDEEKDEYLRTLWSIIVSFVDLGFFVQPYENSCGQLTPDLSDLRLDARTVVDCGMQISREDHNSCALEFDQAASGGDHAKG